MAKNKKAKARQPTGSRKAGKTTLSLPSTAGDVPHFGFKWADRTTDEAWAFKPSPEDARELMRFLCQMGRLTWREIEQQQAGGHKKHHDQLIESLGSDAQRNIARNKLDEIFGDSIFRFRLSGQKRLWGFRDSRTFHAVWWDPNHKVYETEPN